MGHVWAAEYFKLETTCGGHLGPTRCPKQGCHHSWLRLLSLCRSGVNLSTEIPQPFPMCYYSHCLFFPCTQLMLLSMQLVTLVLGQPLGISVKCLALFFSSCCRWWEQPESLETTAAGTNVNLHSLSLTNGNSILE